MMTFGRHREKLDAEMEGSTQYLEFMPLNIHINQLTYIIVSIMIESEVYRMVFVQQSLDGWKQIFWDALFFHWEKLSISGRMMHWISEKAPAMHLRGSTEDKLILSQILPGLYLEQFCPIRKTTQKL